MAKHNKSAGQYRYEYVKHLQKNAFPIVWYLIVFLILSIIVTVLTGIISSPMMNNVNTIKTCKYDYSIESQEKQSVFRQNYKLENLVTFHNNEKRINVNTYLFSETDNGIINDRGILKSDEVIISCQIADKLNVSEGDQIQIDLPIYDTPSTYYVKEIIPYVSDFYNISDNLDFGVAFLGYAEKIEKQTSGKYIFFLNSAEYDNFKKSTIMYDQKHDVQSELSELHSKSVLYIAISLICSFLILGIYHVIISKTITKEIIKYSKDSFSVKILKKYYNIDFGLYSVIPLLMLIIFGLLLGLSFYNILGYACISGFWTLWWLIGGKHFGKAT